MTAEINKRLVIDPLNKTIEPKYRNQKLLYVAKGDRDSVIIGFEIPRHVDGYDMSADENVIHIHYANMDKEDEAKISRGFSDAIEVKAEEDEATGEERVSFCWLVPKSATRYAGVVSVGVTFERYDNVDGETQEIYSWSIAPYGEIVVRDSMDNSAETIQREYDYLVDTCNKIVEEALRTPLAQIKENAESVLKEAKEHSYSKEETNNMFAGALKNTVLDTRGIVLRDVAEPTHDIQVKTVAGAILSVYSGNLLNATLWEKENLNVSYNIIRNATVEDGEIFAQIENAYYIDLQTRLMNSLLQSLDGKTLTFSVNALPYDAFLTVYIKYTDFSSNEYQGIKGANELTFTLNLEGRTIDYVIFRPFRKSTPFTDTSTVIRNIQLELGDTATEYCPYVEPTKQDVMLGETIVIPPLSDMTIISDTNGVEIEVTYNKDINKVYAKQQAEIDELRAMILELTTN